MKRHAPRPRIHRSFLDWLGGNQARFLVPIRIKNMTSTSLDIDFIGITKVISAYLLRGEFRVQVEWNGIPWDTLIYFEVSPIKQGEGYVCDFCDPKQRTVFEDRESLWRDHLFEPFLLWVNTSLAPANWLVLYGTADRFTAAWFMTEITEPPSTGETFIPVRDES
jgi:hypothetical protein